MLRILVCLSDNLLKLRIKRILSKNNIVFKITEKPIKKDDLINYDIIIIHSSYHLSYLFNFIENAVIRQATTFFYISSSNHYPFRNLKEHQNIIYLDENKMDIELLFAIKLRDKYQKVISNLLKENNNLKISLKELRLMNSCKRKLMSQGYTEEAAHKFILKYAMNNHLDKIEACNRLLAD